MKSSLLRRVGTSAMLALVALLSASVAHAQDNYFSTNTTIDGYAYIPNSAIVGYANLTDFQSGVNVTSPTVNVVSGGFIGVNLQTYGGSTANVSDGAYIGYAAYAFDNSTINMTGGYIYQRLVALGNSTVYFSGGSAGNDVTAQDNSTVHVSGGLFTFLYQFDQSVMHLYGTGITLTLLPNWFAAPYDEYALSGRLADGTDLTHKSLFVYEGATPNVVLHNLDGIAPVITTPGDMTVTAISAAGAVVSFSVTATDDVDGPVPVTCSPASGSTFAPGKTTVTCTATDAAGNTATKAFTVWVQYSWSGVLQPLNADGSSVFKAGSTVSIKFALTGASASITNLAATLSYQKISGSDPGTVNEATSTSAATAGSLFLYDASSGQYLFNWSTKGLTTGKYRLYIDLGDGVTHTVDLGLK